MKQYEQIFFTKTKITRKLRYDPLFKAGNARRRNISISGKEYYKALFKASGVNPLSYCESSLDSAIEYKNSKCALGDAEISISATGDVYPIGTKRIRIMSKSKGFI
jgi:hypothetical protein